MLKFPVTDRLSSCWACARGLAAPRERLCSLSHLSNVGVVAAFLICTLCYWFFFKDNFFHCAQVLRAWGPISAMYISWFGALIQQLFILLSDNVIFNSVHIKPLWSKPLLSSCFFFNCLGYSGYCAEIMQHGQFPEVISFAFTFLKNIFYWLCCYSCTIFPPSLPSALLTPSLPHSPQPLVHVNGSYI